MLGLNGSVVNLCMCVYGICKSLTIPTEALANAGIGKERICVPFANKLLMSLGVQVYDDCASKCYISG